MEINIGITFQTIPIITGIFIWCVLAAIAYKYYKKSDVKPKAWKIFIVLFIGLFSFSFNWMMFDALLKLPILPLGVWILYAVLNRKEGRWQTYRPFAWLGFWANFLFLAGTLIEIPIQQVVYPKDEPTTYISDVEQAAILPAHPSANKVLLNKGNLIEQLEKMEQAKIYSDQWYEDTYVNNESNIRNERFPYQLTGALPKWGSGIQSIIYIEEDGKGILVTTSQNQYYFRTNVSILEGVR